MHIPSNPPFQAMPKVSAASWKRFRAVADGLASAIHRQEDNPSYMRQLGIIAKAIAIGSIGEELRQEHNALNPSMPVKSFTIDGHEYPTIRIVAEGGGMCGEFP